MTDTINDYEWEDAALAHDAEAEGDAEEESLFASCPAEVSE